MATAQNNSVCFYCLY